ncbi:leishmanolysin-like peptidase isoform X2 [Mobula hypostoma]|uniref:leishmanolysin-like peptidase isoform X2 n=1 Tax=Mobula hypostoma TaxID=723540 RepID=UPI002FC3344D
MMAAQRRFWGRVRTRTLYVVMGLIGTVFEPGACYTCKHRVPDFGEVIYQVYIQPPRITRRSVDQHLRIKIVYDLSIELLPLDKKNLVKNKLFPKAITYLQNTFQVRKVIGPILLSRPCATNQYLRKKDDPYMYCQGACAKITRCGPVIVPEEHLQQCRMCSENGNSCGSSGLTDGPGVKDADFLLYVSALTTERCGQEDIVAYAAYCQLEAELDRPIAGYANLCPSMIPTEPQEFQGMLSTVKHEIVHALGFSAGLFAFYRDDEGKPLTVRKANGLPPFNESLGLYQWSEKVARRAKRLWNVRGNTQLNHEVLLLVTPRVVKEAQQHFNCSVLEGMELENQGGVGTELNHWEKRLLENEAMTGSHTQNRVFSRLTLAALEDTGWYKANYSMADKLEWGEGMGCDFVMNSCKLWIDQQRKRNKNVTPYCDTPRTSPLRLMCRQDQRAVAVCNLEKYPVPVPKEYQYFDHLDGIPEKELRYYGGSVEIADYCPFTQEFSWYISGKFQRGSDCRISQNQPEPSRNYGAEEYGPDSVCLIQQSYFVMQQCNKMPRSPDWGSGCYRMHSRKHSSRVRHNLVWKLSCPRPEEAAEDREHGTAHHTNQSSICGLTLHRTLLEQCYQDNQGHDPPSQHTFRPSSLREKAQELEDLYGQIWEQLLSNCVVIVIIFMNENTADSELRCRVLMSTALKQISCSTDGLIVWVSDKSYLCSQMGQVLSVNVKMNDWVYTGSLVCPSCSDFCTACPPERDPPLSNFTKMTLIDPCSSSSGLVITLWLVLTNFLPLMVGFFLCVWN